MQQDQCHTLCLAAICAVVILQRSTQRTLCPAALCAVMVLQRSTQHTLCPVALCTMAVLQCSTKRTLLRALVTSAPPSLLPGGSRLLVRTGAPLRRRPALSVLQSQHLGEALALVTPLTRRRADRKLATP